MNDSQIIFRPLVPDAAIVAKEPPWADLARFPIDIEAARRRYRDLLSDWANLHGLNLSDLRPEADTEDWTENAVKLIAAVRTGAPTFVIDDDPASGRVDFHPVANTTAALDPETPTVFLGMLRRWDLLFRRTTSDELPANLVFPPRGHTGSGDGYWRNQILLRSLERATVLSSGNAGGADGYVASVRKLLEAGKTSLISKVVFQIKYQSLERFDFPDGPDTSDRDIEDAFMSRYMENLMDFDEREECLLIQDVIPLEHEYRIVVADGRPVAGAGTVEWLSPLFHDDADGPFDPLVEGKRSDRELARRPDIVERFVAKAQEICLALDRAGDENFAHCTMDFAIDTDKDEVCLIETNPCTNYGLYAMDFDPVASAIVGEARRMTPDRDPTEPVRIR